jgi:hypothetical protein
MPRKLSNIEDNLLKNNLFVKRKKGRNFILLFFYNLCFKRSNKNKIPRNDRNNTWSGLICEWWKHGCRIESPYRYSVVPLCWPTVAATRSSVCFMWTEGSAASLLVNTIVKPVPVCGHIVLTSECFRITEETTQQVIRNCSRDLQLYSHCQEA